MPLPNAYLQEQLLLRWISFHSGMVIASIVKCEMKLLTLNFDTWQKINNNWTDESLFS